MFTGVLAGDDGRTGGRARGVRAVGAIKEAPSLGQTIKVGGFYLRVVEPNRIPMLLIARDEQDVWSIVGG